MMDYVFLYLIDSKPRIYSSGTSHDIRDKTIIIYSSGSTSEQILYSYGILFFDLLFNTGSLHNYENKILGHLLLGSENEKK
jgi:hypothetical protein